MCTPYAKWAHGVAERNNKELLNIMVPLTRSLGIQWPSAVRLVQGAMKDIGTTRRYVVNLHGQINPGRARRGTLDDAPHRQRYFTHGLKRLTETIRDRHSYAVTVTMSFRIGCGL